MPSTQPAAGGGGGGGRGLNLQRCWNFAGRRRLLVHGPRFVVAVFPLPRVHPVRAYFCTRSPVIRIACPQHHPNILVLTPHFSSTSRAPPPPPPMPHGSVPHVPPTHNLRHPWPSYFQQFPPTLHRKCSSGFVHICCNIVVTPLDLVVLNVHPMGGAEVNRHIQKQRRLCRLIRRALRRTSAHHTARGPWDSQLRQPKGPARSVYKWHREYPKGVWWTTGVGRKGRSGRLLGVFSAGKLYPAPLFSVICVCAIWSTHYVIWILSRSPAAHGAQEGLTEQPIFRHGDTLHCRKALYIWAWGHFARPKRPLYMGMGTLCTAEKPPIYGHGDHLHCQKGPYIWAWGHFALPKRPLYMGMGALCTAQKPPIYTWAWGQFALAKSHLYNGQGDTLHCSVPFYIRAWGHFALLKSSLHMGMGTLCTAIKALTYGHGHTLHCSKAFYVWAWGHFALPETSLYMGMGTICTGKKGGHKDSLHYHKAPYIWAWGYFELPRTPVCMGMETLCTAQKLLIYGHEDILHCQKALYVWAWGHFVVPHRPIYMGMGTRVLERFYHLIVNTGSRQ